MSPPPDDPGTCCQATRVELRLTAAGTGYGAAASGKLLSAVRDPVGTPLVLSQAAKASSEFVRAEVTHPWPYSVTAIWGSLAPSLEDVLRPSAGVTPSYTDPWSRLTRT